MKRSVFVFLTAVFVLSVSVSLCHAQTDRTVTNTSKKGSLLVWPLIRGGTADTMINLSNDYYESVKVKCVYRFPSSCARTEWTFTLQPNQPVSWMASTGKGPDGKAVPHTGVQPSPLAPRTLAELKCWAVDSAGTQQIAWNWLSGSAVVGEADDRHWEYSAWRFAVNSATTGVAAGLPGEMLLTGDSGNYDACPTGLLFNFLRQTRKASGVFPAGTVDNRLALVPCRERLAGNLDTIVYTKLVRRTETGKTLSTASVCVGCDDTATQWFYQSLAGPKVHLVAGAENPFTHMSTRSGTIYVHGRKQAACAGSVGSPLLGVMSMRLYSGDGPVVGVAPTAIGPGQAYIRNANDVNTSTPVSITW